MSVSQDGDGIGIAGRIYALQRTFRKLNSAGASPLH